MEKVRIVWNGQGGELDSRMVTKRADDDAAVRNALIEMIQGNIVNAGDSFTVEEVA